MVSLLFKIILGLLCLLIILGLLRTWEMEYYSKNQTLFLSGKATTETTLDGFYNGSVPGRTVSWLGKKFDAKSQTGINIFDDGNGVKGERYPFKTYSSKGVRDEVLPVIAIDYNISENPLWLRLILDEIVEIAPNHYLGKLHLRIIPYTPFTLGYFELKK